MSNQQRNYRRMLAILEKLDLNYDPQEQPLGQAGLNRLLSVFPTVEELSPKKQTCPYETPEIPCEKCVAHPLVICPKNRVTLRW